MKLYFRDNLFNSGKTAILNEREEQVGVVDLHSAFGSSLDVTDGSGRPLYGGRFPFMSGKWTVTGPSGDACGRLRYRMALFSKKYEYDAYGRGVYEITSPAFSREYEIRDENGTLVAGFEKINNWFAASAFCLDNRTDRIDSYEWVAVVLGMHAIQSQGNS